MLEKMNDFFNKRLDGYEKHQLEVIESAQIFYPFTAEHLPMNEKVNILDLGCGTGLELDYYFRLNPTAKITGIDLAEDMLSVLKQKFSDKAITLINASYFDVEFKNNYFDAVVSVESLHHFTKIEKVPLYKKIYQSLISGGYFILTDYFVESDEEELFYRNELIRLKTEQGITDNEFYHYDTPLTIGHEVQALKEAGFNNVEIIGKWGSTCTLKAIKY